MYMTSYKIRSFIRDVKAQWKKRAIKKGLSYIIISFVSYFLLYLLIEYISDVSPLIRGIEFTAASVTVLYFLINNVLRPAIRKYDDKQIALYIEEKFPDLEDRINSAVEVSRSHSRKEKDLILDQLIDDAVSKTRFIDPSAVVDRKKEKILYYISNAVLVLFLIFLYTFFNDISNLLGSMDMSFNPVAELKQESMSVEPGDIQIEKGESQEIIVKINQETEVDVILHYISGEDIWRNLKMEKGLDKPLFIHQFFNVQEPVRYYVQYQNDKSQEFTISLYEFPKVTKIDLKYVYPDYIGLPPRIEENTGDIIGLKGSNVSITIETSGSAVSGNMVIDKNTSIPLNGAGENKFETTIPLTDSGYYYIDLADSRDQHSKFPEEYQITPVNDEKPIIHITEPQRDVRANLVEEILVAATVTDDYGIERVNIKYSVNGEDDKTVKILDDKTKGEKNISSSHLFYLEEYDLQPGDVISYYIEAGDNCAENVPEYSDMYFIEITSLDTRFSQSRSNGGSRPGGGSQSQIVLNQQEIISATWKLERTKETIPEDEFIVSALSISTAQSQLKDNINSRLTQIESMTRNPDENVRKLIENLKSAVNEMSEALVELEKPDLRKALKEEQQALTYLLRAEALNNERQVAMQQRGSRSNSGGGGNDRISELMDLELDISKQKYEMQQQREQVQQSQEVDEALQKIKDLARRQEKLAERAQNNIQNEEDERALDRLKRDQEDLRQQAEELANQLRNMSRDNQQLSRQTQQRMDRISQNMKKAEEELKNNNPEEALSHQQMALNELEQLKTDLQMSQADNYREMTGNFVRKFEQFKEQEDNFDRDLDRTYKDLREKRQNRMDTSDIERLSGKRNSNYDELKSIEEQAQVIEELTKKEDPDITATLKNFQNDLKRERLDRNMQLSKNAIDDGWVVYAKIKEYEIQESIERLDSQIRKLESKLPMTEEEELNRSLKDVRELLQKYNEISESINDRVSRESETESGQNEGQNIQREAQAGETNREMESSEAARMQRQLERMREMADDIQRSPGANREFRNSMQSIRNQMGKLDNIGVLLDLCIYNPP
ncbi:hypothetical protein ACFL4T_09085, partial [candidate division KSB1 bacterium]